MAQRFEQAGCAGAEWWPWADSATDKPALWARARGVCEACPCRSACAAEALSFGAAIDGLWAGERLSRSLGGRRVRELLGPLVEAGRPAV